MRSPQIVPPLHVARSEHARDGDTMQRRHRVGDQHAGRGTRHRETMLARLADLGSRELAIVAEHEGEVGGFGWLESHDDRPGYRFACETSIYLSPRAWGTGLGDLPQRALLEAGAALQYRHVVAKILSVNSRSLRFHARPGFELVGVQRSVGRVGDDWHHVSILQYLLD